MKLTVFTLLIASCCLYSYAQKTVPVSKNIKAKRVTTAPKIDGIFDEAVWKDVIPATGFIENNPLPGRIESHERRTEVRFLYDDDAIYVAARMLSPRDSISRELVSRDEIGSADFIGVVFDTFLDKTNGYGFYVTAAGVQFDAKYSQVGGEDENWNAVWESSVKVDDTGWNAEFRIPYSALRFSDKEVQSWGLNLVRKRFLENSQTFWNFVDPKVNGFLNQSGILEGLEKIEAPLRLSFTPYVSAYANHYPYHTPGVKNASASFNGGMDVKYGINKSFTLDMTLIPDFGQVQSDSRILNLTPFEVKFDENRSFFTEGTELFNKGDLFYSRRIGTSPSYFNTLSTQLKPGETVVKSPQESKVLNATKISGRTAKGLGVGVFNAITNTMYAEVEDTEGNRRKIENQPLTNYNVLVLDQSLKNNSSVSVINTNILREGAAYDANVSAFLFSINDKDTRYYVNGNGKLSYLTGTDGNPGSTGYSYLIETGNQSGTFTWSYTQQLADRKFDPSDMGFYTNNNFFDQSVVLHYNIYKPGKWYNKILTYAEFEYSRMYKPGAYQSFSAGAGPYVQLKNFWSVELNVHYNAVGTDFYEARNGMKYQTPENYGFYVYVNPNRAKAYNFGGHVGFTKVSMAGGNNYDTYFFQNLRLSNRFNVGLDLRYEKNNSYINWVAANDSQTLFSRYDRNTIENSFDCKYSFSNKMGINARIRHYWSDRRNKDYYLLNTDGTLSDYTGTAPSGTDRNYNVFNIDLVYTWQFAPGSELSITYKDISETNEDFYTSRYSRNISNILNSPQNNSLSVKMLYFIDYHDLRKKKKP
ncbi:DUF5916 domain-containing protein [Pedobacter metabolipauper]|uniref:Carbohydrate binding protein with CBM9 domain n=1 Tax=Pedobacter metabolipauper TaxID=425513 RepID=A0A4R6SZ06_9SPHI|nr:DUF5916 domain-containing protein [Pedobacter metabolipauper]TDQ11854.1 carbohydrate binding protein with CBM9 domain [Pedobacter metabolipauper]